MFQVHVQHPLTDDWEARDEQMKTMAGRKWNYGWADSRVRFLCWEEKTLALAKALQTVLASVAGTTVTVREQ